MKKRKLRKWVKPTITILTLIIIVIGISYTVIEDGGTSLNNNYTINAIIDDTKPIVEETDNIIKPFDDETVNISKKFYNKDDDEKTQENSLIFYENIYIQNTGILYSSDNTFDILSVADGTIKNIKEDKILGTIIEIENNNSLTTVYQSVSEVNVQVGETITKGTKIASSGNNNLANEKDNCLLFQVYLDGNLINPETIYGMDIKTINDQN